MCLCVCAFSYVCIYRNLSSCSHICYREHVLAYVGLPKVFQSDNGGEFVNTTLGNLLNIWPGEVSIVHSRPRRPQVSYNN